MWKLIGGVFVGWSLGSNDSANLFGTGVAAKVVEYRTAIILISVFVVIGALRPIRGLQKYGHSR
jgi:PiT family inorganic phosphate transporter